MVGPLLLILLIGVVELGFAMYQAMQVYNAVEAGMVYASKNGWNQTAISNAVVNASNVSGMIASPAPSQFCGCPQSGGIAETVCAAPLPLCADSNPAGRYIRINAALPRQKILPFLTVGLPDTLTAQSILREIE